MLRPQQFFRLTERHGTVRQVRIYLAPRRIWLREFYSLDLVYHYYKILIPAITNSRSSVLYLLTGPHGTGKTSFVQWMLGGLHTRRPVYFLGAEDFTEARMLFLHQQLQKDSQRILVFELDGLSRQSITALLTVAFMWAGHFKGLKILGIRSGEFQGDTEYLDLPQLGMLPYFGLLPVEQSNQILRRMRVEREAETPMTLREIFAWVAEANPEWKMQQQ
jgi:hypothetical protein